ncbi:MAG: hypothetical protein H0U53_06805 [Actinobacteria bacterium]|jgi:hypothetical protein|nr:hypothetical protein [Actinomycetota bacterium]
MGVERVVLGRRDDRTMVGFQWTGAEPQELSDTETAVALGAVWEGDELVSYNMDHLRHNLQHNLDGFLEDSD